jgi:hypothetical protein
MSRPQKATFEEHGHIFPWNDDSRGAQKLIAPVPFSRDLNFTLQVISGRKPFEHNSDKVVVWKVLHKIRPGRPPVGFSDALWALLTQTWLEEFEITDTPSARPNITNILKLLHDEAKNLSQTSMTPSFPSPMELEPSGASAVSSELAYGTYLI